MVTGGSRGIGAAIVKRLAREGAHVALTYVSKPAQANETALMALPRYGTVDEVAAMVAYLAGPEAGFVTGASLTIDGGFTA